MRIADNISLTMNPSSMHVAIDRINIIGTTQHQRLVSDLLTIRSIRHIELQIDHVYIIPCIRRGYMR